MVDIHGYSERLPLYPLAQNAAILHVCTHNTASTFRPLLTNKQPYAVFANIQTIEIQDKTTLNSILYITATYTLAILQQRKKERNPPKKHIL